MCYIGQDYKYSPKLLNNCTQNNVYIFIFFQKKK